MRGLQYQNHKFDTSNVKPFPTRIDIWRSPILKKNGNMNGLFSKVRRVL